MRKIMFQTKLWIWRTFFRLSWNIMNFVIFSYELLNTETLLCESTTGSFPVVVSLGQSIWGNSPEYFVNNPRTQFFSYKNRNNNDNDKSSGSVHLYLPIIYLSPQKFDCFINAEAVIFTGSYSRCYDSKVEWKLRLSHIVYFDILISCCENQFALLTGTC